MRSCQHSLLQPYYFVVLLLLLGIISSGQAQDGAQLYKTYCAGCHGAQLQGGSATTLIKTDWTYGRGRGALIRNVKFGIPSTEMAAWHSVLSDEQIGAVVDFVIEAQATPPSAERPIPEQLTTEEYKLKVEAVVTDGLETPWGMTFVDEHRALITERPGRIRWLVDGKLDPQPIQGVPPTYESKTGGYMDIISDPNYASTGWVYLAFSHTDGDLNDDGAPAMTKIVRGKIKDHQWTEQETLFEVPDSLLVVGGNRWGCRFLFDEEGLLYFSIGDMDQAMDSQDPGKATGKTFRIHPDGSIPEDNPFAGEPGALAAIFTLGNRNVQGIAQHPVTGDIWATEHGPMGGDELNILKMGANYGWPVITYGVDYSGEIVSEETQQPGMEQPVTQWTPSIAVCPATFSDSPLFPQWENNLLVGALAYEELRRLVIENKEVVRQEMILKGVGRVRDIVFGPEGALYILLNQPDKILRLIPDKKLP
ncbi:MAG: PQQ-dependent sugar dehydrogenase [Cyclobacteriaceae bacterium]